MYTVNFIVYGVDTAEYRLKGKWTEATNNPCRQFGWVGMKSSGKSSLVSNN